MLDKGQEDDWFSSNFIVIFSALAVIGLIALIVWELREARLKNRPILDLKLFASRHFCLAFLMMFVLGFTLYAANVLLPQLLQSLMGYTAELSGLAMSTGGLATILCMPLAGILISRIDSRYLIVFGFGCMAVALYFMTHLNLQMSFAYAAKLRFFRSIGLPFLFVPINTLIYLGIQPGKNNDVSGLSNLARNIGGSAGTSFFTTVLARHQQVHQTYLVQHVIGSGSTYQQQVSGLSHQLSLHSGSATDTQNHVLLQMYQSLQAQASILSYIDIIRMLSIFCGCMIPLVFLMNKPPKGTEAAVH